MSLKDYNRPFTHVNLEVFCKAQNRVAKCNTTIEAIELCSILNVHFAPKENPKGVCDKCVQPHDGSRIGRLCGIPGCGGKVVESIPFTVDAQPQPNREETDRVAAEYYKRGRVLEVQAFVVNAWTDQTKPGFSYDYAWRIKPTKRRVVVEVHESPAGKLICCVVADGNVALPKGYRFLGAIEGEVEA